MCDLYRYFAVTLRLLHRYFASISAPVLHTRVQLHAAFISLATCRAAHLPFIFCSVSCTQLQSDVPQNKGLCTAQSPLRAVFFVFWPQCLFLTISSLPWTLHVWGQTCSEVLDRRPKWNFSQGVCGFGALCKPRGECLSVCAYKMCVCNVDFELGFESGQEQENVPTGSEANRHMFNAHLPRGKVAEAWSWPLYLSSVEHTVDWRNTSPPPLRSWPAFGQRHLEPLG